MDETCIHADSCANLDKSCRKCFGYNMYREKKVAARLGSRRGAPKSDKEGMGFEERGKDKYNKAVRSGRDAAHRQWGSGNQHHSLGDVISEEILTASLAEYKERGTLSKSGEKQITIKKEWLDEIEREARIMNREFYFLPFTFKNQEKDYVAMDYDRLLAYIQIIQNLSEQVQLLQLELSQRGSGT